jgi:hypothetical protein
MVPPCFTGRVSLGPGEPLVEPEVDALLHAARTSPAAAAAAANPRRRERAPAPDEKLITVFLLEADVLAAQGLAVAWSRP